MVTGNSGTMVMSSVWRSYRAVAYSGLLKTLSVGDIAGDFYVSSYQRGYRWANRAASS